MPNGQMGCLRQHQIPTPNNTVSSPNINCCGHGIITNIIEVHNRDTHIEVVAYVQNIKQISNI